MSRLHIDIETFSSLDLSTCGVYEYARSVDFEILLFAYAFDNEPVQIIDIASGETIPNRVKTALNDPVVTKHAFNANFERICLANFGYNVPVDQWRCTMLKSAYCGLSLKLEIVSQILNLGTLGKLEGDQLIRFFCKPCKPTKKNHHRKRNLPYHDPEQWSKFIEYCINDVEAERQIELILAPYVIPEKELSLYRLDQKINDLGVKIDKQLAQNCIAADSKFSADITNRMKVLTGLDNPNSAPQLKKWIQEKTGYTVKSLKNELIPQLITLIDDHEVTQALKLRSENAKTSTAKYQTMINSVGLDDRIRGLLQHYGANRTGRWAGRLVQIHNLVRNSAKDLDYFRTLIQSGDFETFELLYGSSKILISELVRTTFIAQENYTFAVADFNAIEARVTAWLANEIWRLELFKNNGKLYETSAALMFNEPIENVTKDSPLRQKGKIAELALGYGGSVGALKQMDKDGKIPDGERKSIVKKWRSANPAIVKLWADLENSALAAVATKTPQTVGPVTFSCDSFAMRIHLPSGRELFYYSPSIGVNRWNKPCVQYWGLNQTTKQWVQTDTYGGKLTENLAQAISRDLLAHSMLALDSAGFTMPMHVHDEVVNETLLKNAEFDLKTICEIMGEPVPWALGLPLKAAGFTSKYYLKD